MAQAGLLSPTGERELKRGPEFHLAFIDGMRGVCALYIVLHHICVGFGFPPGTVLLLGWGGYVVTVFLVISGYCLMLPVVRNDFLLRDGAMGFYLRRARRILPPYYAALLLSFALYLYTDLHAPSHTLSFWRMAGLHLALIHNLVPGYEFTLNGPLWSVALECQIYLLFPLLLYAWRKYGAVSTVVAAVLLSSILSWENHYNAKLHYFGVFAMGAFAAEVSWLRHPSRRVLIAVGLVAAILWQLVHLRNPMLGDLCVGLDMAAVMAYFATHAGHVGKRVLSWRGLTSAGTFAYSIYLVHALVLAALFVSPLSARLPSAPWPRFGLLCCTLLPIVLLFSYGFYLLCERPFLSRSSQRAKVVTQFS